MCVVFWFFSIQMLKKHKLKPEITLLYQFHAQKALFKVPKICNINFWIENDPPPPLALFQNFIRFGSRILPLWRKFASCVCKLTKYVRNCVVFWKNLHSWQKLYTTASRDGRDKFQVCKAVFSKYTESVWLLDYS